MCDNTRTAGTCCRISCSRVVALILTVLLFFVGGAIFGAYAAELVTSSIVAFAILGIILAIASVTAIFLSSCRCRG